MMTLSRNNDTLPVAGLVALTQTALGFGVGLMMAGRMKDTVQKTTVISALAVSVVCTLSLAAGAAARLINHPTSSRQMRRRLKSIREDSGFPDDAEIF